MNPRETERAISLYDSERRWKEIEASLGALADEGHEWDRDPAAWVRAERHANAPEAETGRESGSRRADERAAGLGPRALQATERDQGRDTDPAQDAGVIQPDR